MPNLKISRKLVNEVIKEIEKRQKTEEIKIPISVFSTRNLTAFEALTLYLKNLGHNYHEIAVMLKRDDRTIWSTYQRAKKKKMNREGETSE